MDYILLLSNLIMIGFFIFRFNRIPPQVPIFNSRPEGEEQLGDWWFIFLIPLALNLFIFFNSFLVKKIFKDNHFVLTVIGYFNWFLIIAFTLIFIRIILLVT
jgi:hypothetical protein